MQFFFGRLPLSLCCLLLVFFCTAQKANKRPNILILCADEWRGQATGYGGDENVKTPNIDAMAAKSANFPLAVSGLPVCTPWRASLLTGQRPLTNGIFMNDVLLDTNAVTMAKVLAKNGYKTGYIGKWHLDGPYRLAFTPPGNRRQGFQYWKAGNCDHNYNHSVYYDNDDSTRRYWDGYDVIAEAKDAQQYIRDNAHGDQPFFLMLSWAAPHDPYHTAPQKYKQLYDSSKIVLRPNVPDSMRARARYDLAGYYAHMSAIDEMFGQILQTLKEEGMADNTIVLFTSDHGDLVGSHGAYFKQRPYNESVSVPMLFYYTGNKPIKNGKYPAMINTEDIMPTLLGLTGVDVPGTVEGINFSDYMKGERQNPKDTAAVITCIQPFGQWIRKRGGREFRGIRTPNFTYVRDMNGPWLLYDNTNDPYQLTNLIGTQQYAGVQKKLDALLAQKLKKNHDEFLSGLEYVKRFNYPALDATETVPYFH